MNVFEAINQSGLSPTELRRKTGVGLKTVNRWLAGEKPTKAHLLLLQHVLKVDIDEARPRNGQPAVRAADTLARVERILTARNIAADGQMAVLKDCKWTSKPGKAMLGVLEMLVN